MKSESHGNGAISDTEHSAGPRPAARIPRTGRSPPPFHILLAHAHCLFSQGLAAFLAAQPDIESLDRATDGSSAWRLIRTRRPHIALLDQTLDELEATEIVERVQAKGLATRCFVLTDRDAAVVSAPSLADTAGCLSKESGFEDLIAVLRGVDAKETVGSPSVRNPALSAAAKDPCAAPLSPREREVVRLIAAGQTNKTIARALGVSPETVHTHRGRLMTKLGVHSAVEVVRYAVRTGLLD